MVQSKGPVVCLISGIALLIIGICVYLFLVDIKKDRGPAWLIIALGIIFVTVAVIWWVVREREEKAKEEKANGEEAR